MKIRSMKLFLLLVLGLIVDSVYAQKELLGVWEGTIVSTAGDISSTLNTKFYLESFKENEFHGTMDSFNAVRNKRYGPNPFKGNYLFINGTSYLTYIIELSRTKGKGLSRGEVRLAYVPGTNSSTLSGIFTPFDKSHEGKHASVVVSLTRQGIGLAVGAAALENDKSLTGQAQNTTTVVSGPSSSGSKSDVGITGVPSSEGLSLGAAQLFKNVKSKLTVEEKNLIYQLTGFQTSKDGKQFILKDMDEYPFDIEIFVLDVNDDGTEEIFIGYGNTATSGNAGSSSMAFAKQSYSGYVKSFDQQGMLPSVVSGHNGIGLLIGVPGFTYPVYWISGSSYSRSTIKDKELNGQKLLELSELQNLYQNGGSKAVADRLEKLRLAAWDLKRQQQQQAETAMKRRIAEQKGKVGKFIGKWWEMGYYNNPYTLAKIGNYYTLTSKKQLPYTGTKLIFNAKMDRLEGWLNTPNLKIKMVVNYIYESDKLEVRALESGQGMPGYLMKYK